MIEGEKVADLHIQFSEVGEFKTDGLIVRVTADQCSIRFIDIKKSARAVIKEFCFAKELNSR
jgi:c-di-GMP-binding flagellar brake protein YcgR